MSNLPFSSFPTQTVNYPEEYPFKNDDILPASTNNSLPNLLSDPIWNDLEQLNRNFTIENNQISVASATAPNNVVNANVVNVPLRGNIIENIIRRERGRRTFIKPSTLTFEVISCYFHLPMKQAARELRIGESPLKKVCKKLGIDRWPFRKLRSWENMAKEFSKFDKFDRNFKKKEVLKNLEERRERLLKEPNLQLDAKTHRLREAYYKKKKQYKLNLASSASVANLSSVVPLTTDSYLCTEEEDEMLKSLLDNSCPPNNIFEK